MEGNPKKTGKAEPRSTPRLCSAFPVFSIYADSDINNMMYELFLLFLLDLIRSILIDELSLHVRIRIVRLWKAAKKRGRDRRL